jgi:hypothetical protein
LEGGARSARRCSLAQLLAFCQQNLLIIHSTSASPWDLPLQLFSAIRCQRWQGVPWFYDAAAEATNGVDLCFRSGPCRSGCLTGIQPVVSGIQLMLDELAGCLDCPSLGKGISWLDISSV